MATLTFTGRDRYTTLRGTTTRGGFSYKQLFVANLIDRSTADALAAIGIPGAIPLSHNHFAAPPQVGPALIGSRRIVVGNSDAAAAYISTAAVKRLLVQREEGSPTLNHPGPFSVATQLAAADVEPSLGITLFGARILFARQGDSAVHEEIYCLLAASREEAAATLFAQFADSRGAHPSVSIEVEDTLFDRPYDANTLLILEHRNRHSVSEFLRQQHLQPMELPRET